MAQDTIAGLAALAVAAFMIAALAACANTEQVEVAEAPAAVVAIPPASTSDDAGALPEFHGARMGRDTLRSRLPSEN